MELEPSLEWLRRQGHRVIRTKSSCWYDAGPRVYQAFPYHWLITPSNDEIRDVFKQSKAVAIRYSLPLDQPEGQLSYHVVYDQGNYELTSLPKKARHDVIKGLKYASYEPLPLACLAKEGWVLREETLARQGRTKAETKRFWENLCLSADGLPGYEAWGVLHEGKLIASLFACTIDDTVDILYQQSLTRHLPFGINNALAYVFTREVLNRPGIKYIFYGLQSLDAPASVDQFKFRMQYSPKPVRQRVIFNPLIEPLIQPVSYRMLEFLLKRFPENHLIAKAEGMMRFYLQGKRSLSEQEWQDEMCKEMLQS